MELSDPILADSQVYSWFDLFAVPLFFLAAGVELLGYQARQKNFPWRDMVTSALLGVGNIGSRLLGTYLLADLYLAVWGLRLFDIQPGVLSLVALLLLVELIYYWFHRFTHSIRWLWSHHIVHHTSQSLTLMSAVRIGWTGLLSGEMFVWLIPVVIGFQPEYVIMAISVNMIYQFWIHTDLIGKLGPIEYIFNTPSHHRVHHAYNQPYANMNFGGMLIIFDRLFGTFAEEDDRFSLKYGVAGQENGHNPLTIVFAPWYEMLADMLRARGLHELAASVLTIPPSSSQAD
jgi:sterol desaturase/sphingolipid hydroxylase (fatty acid hydroxylase superfamily)